MNDNLEDKTLTDTTTVFTLWDFTMIKFCHNKSRIYKQNQFEKKKKKRIMIQGILR